MKFSMSFAATGLLDTRSKLRHSISVLASLGLMVSMGGGVAHAADSKFLIGIVELQLANPFFGKLQKAGVEQAKKHGLDVMTAEATVAGDSATQIAAVENMINRGAKGIVLDPANAFALVPIVKKARAAGIVVVTTNTSLDPATAADASFETDNLAAGTLIGQWAKATLGATPARVAMLDYDLSDKTAKARHDGFLKGYGLSDSSPEIAGTALTMGNVETGQASMENLLSAHPDINVLYTINEPAAQGAFLAIKKTKQKIVVTSIDGSCSGVHSVADGTIGATVMQFPSRMGEMAVDAVVKAVNGGEKPSGFTNTGTILITDQPVPGIDSKDSKWGLENCWGE
ncbi:substrate-binding domain-containing protein [Rhizobium sp. P44RR-XXIV]|uniref:substrate-binding domain-containing protein n=1 Tax=Rhizobium sp. P44RR-XXIV TaxID=1921145 RepID=UPI000987CA37|nr:substrate-binding domain-containing protein [Rhizobium sp. P44RR-XXIV]TIX90796.1 sugar ABC transporter substrate-binding protein [Rhizobium sp. P44RR-XXIV]